MADLVALSSDSERVQAAIVFASGGDADALLTQAELAILDWRDVLMNGGLAHEGWEARMSVELDPLLHPRRLLSLLRLT